MHGGEGEGGVDGGGAGQNPHVRSHLLRKSADLHFSNFATLFGNSYSQKAGAASSQGGGVGGGERDGGGKGGGIGGGDGGGGEGARQRVGQLAALHA